ncbi:MAG: HU family DNA-binding protein [Treponema porcinum]|uniref:HU family DNA-binding protein n=1 Tax=Treponema porcinum TaxID=261392 RepID=UPI00240A6AA7|nr:HU family DNA-binding protein [Treponema porcinum]MDD6898699.1 HU family DNA-binding protein [Treponema porcinum]
MMYSVKQRQNPLDRDAESKFYATAVYGEEIDVNDLAKEISKSCTLTTADIVAVIESFLDKMPQYLKNSNRIRLNKFGIFKLSFSSSGHEKKENVSSYDIKNLRVLFTPSAELKKELSDVCYTRK